MSQNSTHLYGNEIFGVSLNDYGQLTASFGQDFFKRLLGPLVYMIKAPDGEYLYIGSSQNGINRVSSAGHESLRKALEHNNCNVGIVFCSSTAEARSVEREMILKHQPRYNIQGKS